MRRARGVEPAYDIDLEYGRDGELQIYHFYESIAKGNGRVEVKRKRRVDHRLYIETYHDPGRTGTYRPSGIQATNADTWVFVIRDTGIHIAIPTVLLWEMLDDPSSRPAAETNGSCPTRGVLINVHVLLNRLKQKLSGQ